MNPLYVLRKGASGAREQNVKKHTDRLEFLEWMEKHDREISAISETVIEIGKESIPNLIRKLATLK